MGTPTYGWGSTGTTNTVVLTNNATTTAMTSGYVNWGPKFWYKISRRECRLCGTVYEERQRMPLPKPPKREDRIEHKFFYDYCG